MSWIVFADANVLYSRTLRDWLFLLRLGGSDLFAVFSTEDVLAEVIYRYRRKHPNAPGRVVASIRNRLAGSLDDLVGDYEIDNSHPVGDKNDQHVHAAAQACGADFLLTEDHGFTATSAHAEATRRCYEVYTADAFFVLVDDSDPALVRRVTQQQADYWVGKRGTANLCESLRLARCPEFAERVHRHKPALG
ncbi:MAG: PIN domain-containing protein [Propionibacteriaceae bacterium]|nr:PIN domain-containing protein [Propionibacteriaceae bacterium]